MLVLMTSQPFRPLWLFNMDSFILTKQPVLEETCMLLLLSMITHDLHVHHIWQAKMKWLLHFQNFPQWKEVTIAKSRSDRCGELEIMNFEIFVEQYGIKINSKLLGLLKKMGSKKKG